MFDSKKKYMSPEIVNEQITMMGMMIFRVLSKTKKVTPSWYVMKLLTWQIESNLICP